MTELTDEQIAFKVQSGEIDSFGLLVERYESKLKRYGFKFFSHQDDLDDVLQTIFLKVFENIKSFDTKRSFSPWIYRIAHNELINHLKKRKFLPLPLFDLDSFLPQSSKENERELKEEAFDVLKEKEKIEQCLNSLKPSQKEPLILYYFENLTYQEIAAILQVPISTVGVRLKRAKQKVKKICQTKTIF
ncbi:RNA polymerase sigma factor [Candidatus Parcubacteria bacterium]|nr:RNA polymerase sigma factor [Candidatus Parcubacteria bacterium]